MDRRNGTGPHDWNPPDDNSGGSELGSDPGDKIRIRADRGGLAGYCGVGKGEAEMSDKVREAFNMARPFKSPQDERDAAEIERLVNERDTALAAVDQLATQRNAALADVRSQLAANHVIIEERDAAELERTKSRAEVAGLTEDRDTWQQRAVGFERSLIAATTKHSEAIRDCERIERFYAAVRADLAESRAEAVRLQTENEGLRADLLRITAERDTDRLDLAQVRYERDTALAGCKERQTANAALWEAQQAHQRKADHDQMIIEALREALERTEKRLSQAKARQIPPALVGLLGVIRREAAAAEKMISQS